MANTDKTTKERIASSIFPTIATTLVGGLVFGIAGTFSKDHTNKFMMIGLIGGALTGFYLAYNDKIPSSLLKA